MTVAETNQQVDFSQTSLIKQRLYSQYAEGTISRQRLAELIAQVQPPRAKIPLGFRIAGLVVTALAAALIPFHGRQND
jgi:hypothetical protein